jgi:hypothetical protein
MAKLPDNMLATAELLADVKSPLGGAALRRCVSTAYYAIFSCLAALCAGRMARSAPTSETFRLVYRALDHGHARSTLQGHPEFGSPLGDNFRRLQEARHWADYSVDSHPQADFAAKGARFTRSEAQRFIALAREAIWFVDGLPPDAKQRSVVTLVARARR